MKKFVLFETEDNEIVLTVQIQEDTVWLNRKQMSELFSRDIKTIGEHINNALHEELEGQVVVAKFATATRHGAVESKTQTHMAEYYNIAEKDLDDKDIMVKLVMNLIDMD